MKLSYGDKHTGYKKLRKDSKCVQCNKIVKRGEIAWRDYYCFPPQTHCLRCSKLSGFDTIGEPPEV